MCYVDKCLILLLFQILNVIFIMCNVDYLFLQISYGVKVTFHQTKHFFFAIINKLALLVRSSSSPL